MAFSLSGFLTEQRETIIAAWVHQLWTQVGDQYADRPRDELIATVSEAYEANRGVLVNNHFGDIDRFIDKIAQMRLYTGFKLSDVQMAFELFRMIVVPLLAAETTASELCAAIIKINACLTYTIHRFSDRFQSMHQAEILAHNRRLKEDIRSRTSELKASELKYKILVEEINDGYFVVQDGLLVFANTAFCQMHGYRTEEVIGKSFYAFVDPESRTKVMNLYDRGKKYGGTSRTIEYLRLTKRGQSYPTEILAKFTHYDQRLSSIGICRDITERVIMEQKVRENERMAYIGQIATSLSHEIRNPLSSVLMNLQILKKNNSVQGNDQRRIDISVQQVQRLERILKELLDFAKPIQLRFQEESVNRIISSALDLLEMKFKERNVSVLASLDPMAPGIYADREKMAQAVINLLLNALQASAAGGRVAVESRFSYRSDPSVQIIVSDDGCGLPEGRIEDIFKPFFTTKNKGTGLGLSNVRRIVEAHHGRIEAENRHPRGALFKIFLPSYGN